jgi:hypothetical protein
MSERHCECWDEDLECCYCHTNDEGDCVPAVDCGVCVGPC